MDELIRLFQREDVLLAVAYGDSGVLITVVAQQDDGYARLAAWQIDGPGGGDAFAVPFKPLAVKPPRVLTPHEVRELNRARVWAESVGYGR